MGDVRCQPIRQPGPGEVDSLQRRHEKWQGCCTWDGCHIMVVRKLNWKHKRIKSISDSQRPTSVEDHYSLRGLVLKQDWAHRQDSRSLHHGSSQDRIPSQTFLSTDSALPRRSCDANRANAHADAAQPQESTQGHPHSSTPECPTLYGRRNKCGRPSAPLFAGGRRGRFGVETGGLRED